MIELYSSVFRLLSPLAISTIDGWVSLLAFN